MWCFTYHSSFLSFLLVRLILLFSINRISASSGTLLNITGQISSNPSNGSDFNSKTQFSIFNILPRILVALLSHYSPYSLMPFLLFLSLWACFIYLLPRQLSFWLVYRFCISSTPRASLQYLNKYLLLLTTGLLFPFQLSILLLILQKKFEFINGNVPFQDIFIKVKKN